MKQLRDGMLRETLGSQKCVPIAGEINVCFSFGFQNILDFGLYFQNVMTQV